MDLDRTLRALRCLDNRPFTYRIEAGLFLRIQPTGHKVFYAEYRQKGRKIKVTLGAFPDMTVTQAREKLAALKTDESAAQTLGHVAELWLDVTLPRLAPRSQYTVKRRVMRHVLPRFGRMPIKDVKPARVLDGLSDLELAHPLEARRIMSLISSILDFATNRGLADFNPCAQAHKAMRPASTSNNPYLKLEDLHILADALKSYPNRQTALLIAFSACSMLRPVENRLMQWAWIKDDVMTVPAAIMKMRIEHRVPITPFMRALLEAEKELISIAAPFSSFVWASHAKIDGPIGASAVSFFITKAGLRGKFTAHGLRATARTWMAGQSFDFDACELCLAHQPRSATVRAYQRNDLLDKRQEIMAAWSKELEPIFSFLVK